LTRALLTVSGSASIVAFGREYISSCRVDEVALTWSSTWRRELGEPLPASEDNELRVVAVNLISTLGTI
jgi:hypothetical protein